MKIIDTPVFWSQTDKEIIKGLLSVNNTLRDNLIKVVKENAKLRYNLKEVTDEE